MGQLLSTPEISPAWVPALIDVDESQPSDYTYDLPDECLACIFNSLGSSDRNRCSLVCRRWKVIEGHARYRLSLNAQLDLLYELPLIFSRFDSVTKLTLKCDRRSVSVGDETLILISSYCTRITRLKLRACREITDVGMEGFSRKCKNLKKLSVGSCSFGVKGVNAVLGNCEGLEEITVKRLRGAGGGGGEAGGPVGPGVAAVRVVCLKEVYNGECFGPLIVGSKNLRVLKLVKCGGDWDLIFQGLGEKMGNGIVEVHLERVRVSDFGLSAIASCANLETLHLVKTPECTNVGLVSVAERCKLIRKLHIDGWKVNRIGDEGLIAIANNCPNLQELVLIGVNPTNLSLEILVVKCRNLERLALCGSETVGDVELSCIAARCVALKKLCIKNCPVSDHGMEALACGCPNLVKIKVKKCKAVTCEGADSLRASRGSLMVNLDTGQVEHRDVSSSNGVQEVGEFNMNAHVASSSASSGHTGRSNSFKSRLSMFSGRNFMACTLRRWASTNSRNN